MIGALVLLLVLLVTAFAIYVVATRRVAQAVKADTKAIESRTRQALERNAAESNAAESEVMNANDAELLRIARKRLWPDS